jgi:hypothetical protein
MTKTIWNLKKPKIKMKIAIVNENQRKAHEYQKPRIKNK